MELTKKHIARFWMQVKENKDSASLRDGKGWYGKCWEWCGACNFNGYGRFFIHQKSYKAHRIAYFFYYGKLPKNLYICHRCDNPKCVNPLHLWAGTAKENVQDSYKKKRNGVYKSKRATSSSKYYGVQKRSNKKRDVWRAFFCSGYKIKHLGTYKTEKDAALAYDVVAKEYNSITDGKKKPLNFPT